MSNETNITPLQKAYDIFLTKLNAGNGSVLTVDVLTALQLLMKYEEGFALKFFIAGENRQSSRSIPKEFWEPDFKTLYKTYTDGKDSNATGILSNNIQRTWG